MSISEEQRALAAQQIAEQRVLVDYDVVEYTIEQIVTKRAKGEVVASESHPKLVWDSSRQSMFIESVLMGLPMQIIIVANLGEHLQIIDGNQRLRALDAFREDALVLKGLAVLDEINGFAFSDLPIAEQRRFKHRTLRIATFSGRTDIATVSAWLSVST